MNGQVVSFVIVVLTVLVIAFVCIRNTAEEKKRIRERTSRTLPEANAASELRGDLARQLQPSDEKPTKNQKYAHENNMWICPLCETFVSVSRSQCFICDCPKQ